MGNGFVLGGAAEGMESGTTATRGTAQLQQQGEFQRGQLGLQTRRQDFREQQAQQAQARAGIQQADKAVSDALNFTGDVINRLKLAGKTPQEIQAAIEPIVAQTESALQAQGGDASRLRPRIDALVASPPTDEKGAVVAQPPAAAQPAAGGNTQVEGIANRVGVTLPPVVEDFNTLKVPAQKQMFKANNKVQSTSQLLTELQIFKDQVVNTQTGAISELTLPVRQFFQQSGIAIDENVPAQEALQASQNQLALRLRNPESGFGLTGNTSDRDVKFLKDAVGGLQNTPEGNRAAVIIQIAKMRREAELAALRADLLSRNSPQLFSRLKDEFISQTPLFMPEEETFLDSLKSPQTRTGQGAQRLIFDAQGNQVQ